MLRKAPAICESILKVLSQGQLRFFLMKMPLLNVLTGLTHTAWLSISLIIHIYFSAVVRDEAAEWRGNRILV